MEDCIFCKIIKGDVPSAKVYEDDDVFAFLDIAPATPKKGHVLVIPKEHHENIVDMPEEVLVKVMAVVRKVSKALLKESDGVNLLQNNGKAAGQLVNHLHFHLIPRYEGDGIKLGIWESFKYEEGEIDKFQDKIKKLLNEA